MGGIDGSEVGLLLGTTDGWAVGASVGVVVGLELETRLGLRLGLPLGWFVVGPKESTLDGAGLVDGTVDVRRVGVSLGLEDKLGPTLRMRLGGLDATALGLIEGIPVDGADEDNLEGMLEGALEGQSAVVMLSLIHI